MAQDEIIVRRYAKGLAERAKETGEFAEIRAELGLIANILNPKAGEIYNPDFLNFLESPKNSLADKMAVSQKILQGSGIGKTMTDFFTLLIKNGRVSLLPRISGAFAGIAAELTGEYTAMVQTARPLTEDQAERLTSVLAKALGGVVRLHQQVEPGLLAGARITVGDKTIDGSVLGKLEKLKQHLAFGKGIDNAEQA